MRLRRRKRKGVGIGNVYFIGDGENVKIGYTYGPIENRMRRLQTGNANTLETLAYIRGSRKLERNLHRYFARQRVRGEWYLLPATWRNSVRLWLTSIGSHPSLLKAVKDDSRVGS